MLHFMVRWPAVCDICIVCICTYTSLYYTTYICRMYQLFLRLCIHYCLYPCISSHTLLYYTILLVKAPDSPSSPPTYLAHLSVTTSASSTPPTAATGAATATNTQRSRADTRVEVEGRSSRPSYSADVIGETYFELSGSDGELAITDVMCLQVEYVKTRSPTAATVTANDNTTTTAYNNINNNINNSMYTTASTSAGAAGEDISLLTYNTTASPRYTTQKDGRNPVWQYMLRVKLCKRDNATNNNKSSSSDVYKDREYAQTLAEKRSEL